MNNCKANRCIQCNVNSCKHHCDNEDYCSLDCICVGTHESDPAMDQCTDCRSFENINSYEQYKAVTETKYEQDQ